MLPGAGRFDGGIQRQQVGLVGNPRYGVDDLADFLGLALQFADHFRRFEVPVGGVSDSLDDCLNIHRCGLGERYDVIYPPQGRFRASVGAVRRLLDLINRGPRFLRGGRRLVGARRDGVHGLFQLFHRAGGLGDGARNLVCRGGQLLRHGLRASHGAGARFLLRQFLGGEAILGEILAVPAGSAAFLAGGGVDGPRCGPRRFMARRLGTGGAPLVGASTCF